MSDWKTKWNQHLAEAKKKEDRLSKPEMRNTKEAKRHYRRIGFFLFIIGLAFTLANYIAVLEVGRVLILSVAAMIFFVPFGLWLMIVGKLPRWFAKLSKRFGRR